MSERWYGEGEESPVSISSLDEKKEFTAALVSVCNELSVSLCEPLMLSRPPLRSSEEFSNLSRINPTKKDSYQKLERRSDDREPGPCYNSVPVREKREEIRISGKPDAGGVIYDQLAESGLIIQEITGEVLPSAGSIEIFIGDKTTPQAVITAQEFLRGMTREIRIKVGKGKRIKVVVKGMTSDDEISIVMLVIRVMDLYQV